MSYLVNRQESVWSVSELAKKRLLIQALVAAFSNGYLRGFAKGQIYTGNGKFLCTPGMNCYSCPGALFSCPIGSLQATLNDRYFHVALYAIGFMVLFGTFFGRAVCGFLCPFGLIQDLLFKIPFKWKIRKLKHERIARGVKYFLLVVFVILLPLFVVDITGLGKPWFCKYVCPVGTLEAGIPLVLMNNMLRESLGFLYTWKLLILAVTLLGSIIIYRPFCRYICPLGAIYGFFNRFAIYRFEIDKSKCTGCRICQRCCKFDIDVFRNPNSMDCIRCGDCIDACPEKAIKIKR